MRALPPPSVVPATDVTLEPAVDPAGRAVLVLTLHAERGGIAFAFLDMADASRFAAHLSMLIAGAIAAPPALAALDTPAGPHLVREA